jgi:hypothetical protein
VTGRALTTKKVPRSDGGWGKGVADIAETGDVWLSNGSLLATGLLAGSNLLFRNLLPTWLI